MQELKDYGITFYPELDDETHYEEPNEFFHKLKELAKKKHNVDINPNYKGNFIKVGIVMIGRSETIFKPRGIDIGPYMNYIFTCEEEGIKTIYLLAWGRNIFAAKKIGETLELIPDRFQKVMESNYNVKRQDYTLVANCIRYRILRNI